MYANHLTLTYFRCNTLTPIFLSTLARLEIAASGCSVSTITFLLESPEAPVNISARAPIILIDTSLVASPAQLLMDDCGNVTILDSAVILDDSSELQIRHSRIYVHSSSFKLEKATTIIAEGSQFAMESPESFSVISNSSLLMIDDSSTFYASKLAFSQGKMIVAQSGRAETEHLICEGGCSIVLTHRAALVAQKASLENAILQTSDSNILISQVRTVDQTVLICDTHFFRF